MRSKRLFNVSTFSPNCAKCTFDSPTKRVQSDLKVIVYVWLLPFYCRKRGSKYSSLIFPTTARENLIGGQGSSVGRTGTNNSYTPKHDIYMLHYLLGHIPNIPNPPRPSGRQGSREMMPPSTLGAPWTVTAPPWKVDDAPLKCHFPHQDAKIGVH